jgi:D-arabinose 1-dehydrogenase-like Zn-dependent alcohol dehydrogenase
MRLRDPSLIEFSPLLAADLPRPSPGLGQVLIKVRYCGVCRTDLHVIEGELPSKQSPIIPGHQVVGIVEQTAPGITSVKPGQRVGVAWLHQTCGSCPYCASGKENLGRSRASTLKYHYFRDATPSFPTMYGGRERFLMTTSSEASEGESAPVTVVLNWAAGLRK